jgi:hypothetical protein
MMIAGRARIPLFVTHIDYTNYIRSQNDLMVVDPEFTQLAVPAQQGALARKDVNARASTKAALRTKINDMRNARKKGQMYPGMSGWAKDAPREEFLPSGDIWGEDGFLPAAHHSQNFAGPVGDTNEFEE